MTRTWTIVSVVATMVVVGGFVGGRYLLTLFSVPLPDVPKVEKTVWLEQNWSKDQRNFYHHASQGSSTFGVPYEWFVALERPVVSLSSPGLLSDQDYLDRLGFIPSDQPDQVLPIGFEHGSAMVDPTTGSHWQNTETGRDLTKIGLTCAACHTGRMTYRGTSLLIDGGGALIDIESVRKAMGLSLVLTRYMPFRFDRFADRVIGANARPQAKAMLRTQLDEMIVGLKAVQKLDDGIKSRSVPEGIGRLDALNRIGNQLFGIEMKIDANYAPTSAPVRYPHIWDASWFDWVQYNTSIQQPMVRNAGEALGLGVQINVTGKPLEVYRSNMNINTIFKIEESLRGPGAPTFGNGWTGLRSPRWPDTILPPIDPVKASKGAALYKELCQECHLPPTTSSDFYDPKYRQTFGPHALIVPYFPVSLLDTDPAQATDMANRKVSSPPVLGLTSREFGPALGQVVSGAVTHWYDTQTPPVSPERRNVMNGDLPNGIRALLAYKARPLDGIWATAPYLHNGSVPTLYAILQPVDERPPTFTIGSREFDPVKVGLKSDPIDNGTLIDTSVRGNLHSGHAFDDAGKPGVIGRKLTEDERWDLVEYMKTL